MIVKHLAAVVVCILALLVTLPNVALAQEEWDTSIPEIPVEGDPTMYPDVIEADGDGAVESAEADFVLAQPPYTMNYQGYLTDSADGDYDFVARLYDAASGGTQEWGPEDHTDVPVANGLFNLVLGSTTPLNPNDFDEALFLQLTVEGTDLPVPAAAHDGLCVRSSARGRGPGRVAGRHILFPICTLIPG